jgi:hypothetical protein
MVLRLRTARVGPNEIARRVGVAPPTVRLTLTRLASAGLSWPLPAEMTDSALEVALFAAVGTKQGHRRRTSPAGEIHSELKRKHVTLAMLWDEYIERHPDGYRYSRFCELYRSWASRLSVTMRQAHAGGDKLFVAYAGDTVPVIVDRLTGQVRAAQIFVALLGCYFNHQPRVANLVVPLKKRPASDERAGRVINQVGSAHAWLPRGKCKRRVVERADR